MQKRPREKEKQKLKVSRGNGLKANWNILSAFEKRSIRGSNVGFFIFIFCTKRNKNRNTLLAKAECQSSVPV